MADGEGWLMRPVMRGMCSYESLVSGAVDLCDLARMNEAIDIDDENRKRVSEWANKQHGR